MILFEIQSEHFDGAVKVIQPKLAFPDNRGAFVLTALDNEFQEMGLPIFVRQMYTRSYSNVLRGLHYQLDPPMGKLMQVIHGTAYLVAVDMRPRSSTFLKHHAIMADDNNKLQVWAPAGFARGYYTLEPDTIMHYNTDAYVGEERVIRWDDPDIGIDWPFDDEPILSERDSHAPTWREL